MKRFRNISIYYIIFGVLCALSYVAFQLWRILIPGVILFVVFLILRFVFRIKKLPPKLTKSQSLYVSIFLYALPILFTIWVYWYTERPFRQTIIIPENYEGVVAIKYGQEDGQRQWTGGFLGIGASRLIKVDTFGIAFSQFKFHKNSINYLYLGQRKYNYGMKVYLKNDLKNRIPIKTFPSSYTDYSSFEKKKKEDKPVGYFTGFSNPPLIIFVVTKKSNYHKYFMTEEEILNEYIKKYGKQSKPPSLYNIKKLKEEYKHFYELQ